MSFTIEFDDPANNSQPFFPPLGRKLRGRFVFSRMSNGEAAHKLSARWGVGEVPGQRLRIDPDARTAELIDPLNDAAHESFAEQLRKRGLAPGPNEKFEAIHAPSYIHHARWLVAAGLARVVEGALPETDGGKARTSFVAEPVLDRRDALIDRLVALAFASLPAAKQREIADLMTAGAAE